MGAHLLDQDALLVLGGLEVDIGARIDEAAPRALDEPGAGGVDAVDAAQIHRHIAGRAELAQRRRDGSLGEPRPARDPRAVERHDGAPGLHSHPDLRTNGHAASLLRLRKGDHYPDNARKVTWLMVFESIPRLQRGRSRSLRKFVQWNNKIGISTPIAALTCSSGEFHARRLACAPIGCMVRPPHSSISARESSPRNSPQNRLDLRLLDDGDEHQARRRALSDRRDHVLSRLLHLDSADDLARLARRDLAGAPDGKFHRPCAAQHDRRGRHVPRLRGAHPSAAVRRDGDRLCEPALDRRLRRPPAQGGRAPLSLVGGADRPRGRRPDGGAAYVARRSSRRHARAARRSAPWPRSRAPPARPSRSSR